MNIKKIMAPARTNLVFFSPVLWVRAIRAERIAPVSSTMWTAAPMVSIMQISEMVVCTPWGMALNMEKMLTGVLST